jgi:hypothetical protein
VVDTDNTHGETSSGRVVVVVVFMTNVMKSDRAAMENVQPPLDIVRRSGANTRSLLLYALLPLTVAGFRGHALFRALISVVCASQVF